MEEAALLKSAGLAVLALGHIEDDSMSVELWRSIAFDRAGGVMLESGGDELARRLRCMDVANTRLRVSFQFSKSDADAFTVRLPHTIIAAHERGERN